MEATGRVTSVQGATLKGETAAAESFSVGSYISVPVHDAKILGVVTSVESASNAAIRFTANMFGKSVAGRFERGTEELPWPGSTIEIPSEAELDLIFNSYRRYDFALGEISLLKDKKNYIDTKQVLQPARSRSRRNRFRKVVHRCFHTSEGF